MQFSRNLTDDPEYLRCQLITDLGNKRTLLGFIGHAVERVKRRLSKEKLACADLFSGSGIVSRYFKAHASRLISNDIEEYAAVIGRCFLTNRCELDYHALADTIAQVERNAITSPFDAGFMKDCMRLGMKTISRPGTAYVIPLTMPADSTIIVNCSNRWRTELVNFCSARF